VYFAGAHVSVRRTLLNAGLRTPLVHFVSSASDVTPDGKRGNENPKNS